MNQAQILFNVHLKELGLDVVPEFTFHPTRKWRADFHVSRKGKQDRLLIEIDGGIWTSGRHSGGKGQIQDMEKRNEATKLGYRVLNFTPDQVLNGNAKAFVADVLGVA